MFQNILEQIFPQNKRIKEIIRNIDAIKVEEQYAQKKFNYHFDLVDAKAWNTFSICSFVRPMPLSETSKRSVRAPSSRTRSCTVTTTSPVSERSKTWVLPIARSLSQLKSPGLRVQPSRTTMFGRFISLCFKNLRELVKALIHNVLLSPSQFSLLLP